MSLAMVHIIQLSLGVLCLLVLRLLQVQSATVELHGVRRPLQNHKAEKNFILKYSFCNVNEFRCTDGDCIPEAYRCDELEDCKDKSDEQHCEVTCKPNEYRCNSGECILNEYRCDRLKDCRDNSDESNCGIGCTNEEFTCTDDASCIPNTHVCDLIRDCFDNSDEANCEGGTGGECSSNQFRCKDGQCIPDSFKCDTMDDCLDKSDEADCSHGQCQWRQFTCGDGTCVPMSYKCDSIKDCPDNSDETDCGNEVAVGSSSGCPNCGMKYPSTNRIVYGEETRVNEWPWQVLLMVMKETMYQCGGSLYKDKYVITAAHCLGPATKAVEVYVGKHSLFNETGPEEEKIAASRLIVHPEYGKPGNGKNHDIAIVELRKPVFFSDRVGPICLPGANDDFTGKTAWVAGWGLTEFGLVSDVLVETNITVWPQSKCKLRGSTDNMICGVGERQDGYFTDSCTGDSGGALAYRSSTGKWTLIGIVSHGPFPCAYMGKPGVYTNVVKYLDWIEENTSDGIC